MKSDKKSLAEIRTLALRRTKEECLFALYILFTPLTFRRARLPQQHTSARYFPQLRARRRCRFSTFVCVFSVVESASSRKKFFSAFSSRCCGAHF
jgi:hypothetical protein